MSAFEELLIGASPELAAVMRAARVAAATDVTVLVLGESGTGKELLATAIHRESRRAARPLATINCAALPEGLAEAELFGHRRGAFSGAVQDRTGRIRAADGGTLFLDEIGELPLAIQAKLLRFLESGECQAVGDSRAHHVDVRIIAATNRDLYEEVRAGRFREDLYYRLNVVPLELPALRSRTGDLPPLLEGLTAKLASHHGLPAPNYSAAAIQRLQRYPWPGNVRELRNFCERMLVLLGGKRIEPENLPAELQRASDPDGLGFKLPANGLRLDLLEAQMIRQALEQTRGNRSQAARLLGLSRDALLYRIKKHALHGC
jgi:DNA-binding NtrC family response regulator